MYPHTVTLYSHNVVDGKDEYTKKVLSGVYVYGTNGLNISGHGIDNTATVNVEVPKGLAVTVNNKIKANDRFIVGEGTDITKWSDLKNSYTVVSVADNMANSDIDNITIVGK